MNADKRKGFAGRLRGHAKDVRRRLASIALAALVTAGCGEGDRLSRAELRQQATAVCTPVRRQLEALPRPQSLPELEVYAQEAKDLTESGVEQLRELRPPEGLEDAYDRYLDRAQRVVALLDELEAAAAAGDTAEARRLLGEITEAAETRALARAAGISACEQQAPSP